MLSIEKLREYAKFKSYNVGQAEKDYFQEIVLFILYKEFGKELVFKGGTALTKCYGFDRFSEDLDFNFSSKKDIKKIISSGLDSFYITHEISEEIFKESFSLIIRVEGPLFNGNRNSLCKIALDFSLRETQIMDLEIKKLGLNIDEIPSFDVNVMNQREILLEKIRAILTRDKARDVYDAYYLFQKDLIININDLNKKLSLYNLKFSQKLFKEKLLLKEKIWDNEMKNLTKSYPDFKECKDLILSRVEN